MRFVKPNNTYIMVFFNLNVEQRKTFIDKSGCGWSNLANQIADNAQLGTTLCSHFGCNWTACITTLQLLAKGQYLSGFSQPIQTAGTWPASSVSRAVAC